MSFDLEDALWLIPVMIVVPILGLALLYKLTGAGNKRYTMNPYEE